VVGHAVDPVAIDGVAFAQTTHQFLIEARFVEVEEVAEERRGPDASQGAVGFEEADLGTGAGRGDGGRDAGRTGTADDDVTAEVSGMSRSGSVSVPGFVAEAAVSLLKAPRAPRPRSEEDKKRRREDVGESMGLDCG